MVVAEPEYGSSRRSEQCVPSSISSTGLCIRVKLVAVGLNDDRLVDDEIHPTDSIEGDLRLHS